MIETPEVLEKRHIKASPAKGRDGTAEVVRLGRGAITPEVIALKGKLPQVHWEHEKEILDLVEVAVAGDRQWAVLRRKLMDVMTAHLNAQRALVVEVLVMGMVEEALPTEEIKENVDGNAGTERKDRNGSDR